MCVQACHQMLMLHTRGAGSSSCFTLEQLAPRGYSMVSSRCELSLKERVNVIEYAKKNPRVGSRAIAETFGCGRTQIQIILKNREKILEEYETNAALASRK